MPRDGAIIFSDLTGKLDVLRVSLAPNVAALGTINIHLVTEKGAAATARSSIGWTGFPLSGPSFNWQTILEGH